MCCLVLKMLGGVCGRFGVQENQRLILGGLTAFLVSIYVGWWSIYLSML